MRDFLKVAIALHSDDEQVWQETSRETIRHLVGGIMLWADGEGRNPRVPMPEVLRKKTRITFWTPPELSDLLLWVFRGLFTDVEMKVLASQR